MFLPTCTLFPATYTLYATLLAGYPGSDGRNSPFRLSRHGINWRKGQDRSPIAVEANANDRSSVSRFVRMSVVGTPDHG